MFTIDEHQICRQQNWVFCLTHLNKKTNFLVLGETDYSRVKNGKSTKQKKAEELKLKGSDIEIIPESVFYEMISED